MAPPPEPNESIDGSSQSAAIVRSLGDRTRPAITVGSVDESVIAALCESAQSVIAFSPDKSTIADIRRTNPQVTTLGFLPTSNSGAYDSIDGLPIGAVGLLRFAGTPDALQALAGGRNLIAGNHPAIVIESGAIDAVDSAAEMLAPLGYKAFAVSARELKPIDPPISGATAVVFLGTEYRNASAHALATACGLGFVADNPADRTPTGTGGERVLFFCGGALGWLTMAEALRLHATSQSFFIPSHIGAKTNPRDSLSTVIEGLRLIVEPSHFRQAATLWRAIQDMPAKPDHVHCFGHLAAKPQLFDRLGIPFSVSIDATWAAMLDDALQKSAWHPERIWAERKIAREREVLSKAVFIAATSEWAAKQAVQVEGVDPASVLIVPFPIAVPDHQAEIPAPEDRRWVTFIGNDLERKGLRRLVAWHGRAFPHAELHICTGEQRPDYVPDVPTIVWEGRVPNDEIHARVLPNTRLLVLPTGLDMSPLVLTEAAAAGVPAVASNLGGIPELVIDGQTGFTPDQEDDDGFIEAIKRLLDDDDLHRRFSVAARSRYDTTLDSRKTSGQLFERIDAEFERR